MSLMTLPPELHLLIADELISGLGTNHHGNHLKDLSSLHRTNRYLKSLLDQLISTQGLLVAHKSSPEVYVNDLSRFIASGACTTAVDAVETVVRKYYKSGGRTALHHAAAVGNTAAARILLSGGLPVDALTVSRELCETALVIAIRKRDSDMVSVLLSHGADVEKRADYYLYRGVRYTPLAHAVLSCSAQIVKLLLEYGADPNRDVSAGSFNHIDSLSPLALAVHAYHLDAVSVLLEHGADANYVLPTTKESLVKSLCHYNFAEDIRNELIEFGGKAFEVEM